MKIRNRKLISLLLCLTMIVSLMIPAASASGAVLGTYSQGSTEITSLKTSNLENPIGIEGDDISFGWKMESDMMGQAQQAYQITLNKGAADGPEVWNTGLVESDLSTGILYKGPRLDLETRYYWTVTVTDIFGGTYSNTAYFETGCDWEGVAWLVNPDMPAIPTAAAELAEKMPTPYFRIQKNLSKTVKAATLYITALGGYDAYINGKEVKVVKENGAVLDDLFNPGWSDYYFYLNYQGYDVSSYIGGNQDIALAVQLNRAWHAGGISTRTNSPRRVTQDMALLAKLIITYDDGTREVISTDNTWDTFAGGPILDNDFFNGVNYDARLESQIFDVQGKDWNEVGFPMSANWKKTRQPNWEQTYVNNAAWQPIHKNGYAGKMIANGGNNSIYVEGIQIHPISGYTFNYSEIKQGEYRGAAGTVWQGPTESDLYYGEIVEHPVDVTKPISLKAGDKLILNLGQNIAGFNTLKVSGPEGTVVDMRHDERLNDGLRGQRNASGGYVNGTGSSGPKGTFYWVGLTNGGQFRTASLNPARNPAAGSDGVIDPWGPIGASTSGVNTQGGKYPFSDRLVLAAGATAQNPYTFRPQWTYHGYQYIEISATEDIVIHDLYGEPITSAVERTGYIETNNEAVNRLYENNIWSNKSNLQSTPIDCPNRAERMGWTGDITIYSKTALYNYESAAFLENFQTIMATQAQANFKQTGGFYTPGGNCPTVPGNTSGLGNGWSSPWSDAIIMIVYQIYRATGDTRVINKYFDDLNGYMDGFEAAGYTSGLGDWESLGTRTQARFIGLAYKIYMNQLMVEMSEAIGETARAELYEQRRQKHWEVSLLPSYSVGSTLYWRWGDANMETQTAYFWALLMGMYEDEAGKQDFIERMENVVKNEGQAYHSGPEYTMTIGFAGINAALPALSNNGCNDLAYDLLLQDTYPSWLNHVNNGATTMWEQWDAYNEVDSYGDRGMNSFNHFAYGAVAEWFYTHMAGIEAGKAGFKEIILQPTLDTRTEPFGGSTQERIKDVKGSYNSAYGTIVSNWKLNGTMLDYECTVPANTTATLYLPSIGASAVMANGVPVDKAEGVEVVGKTTHNGQSVVEMKLVSGSFEFTSATKADFKLADIAVTEYEANQPFDVIITTPNDASKVKIVNEAGNTIGKLNEVVTKNADGTKSYRVTLMIGTPGERTISAMVMGQTGDYQNVGASLDVKIVPAAPVQNQENIISVSGVSSAGVNTPFTVTVVTSRDITKVKIVSETGSSIGTLTSSVLTVGNTKVWTLSIKVGTKGNRTLTALGAGATGGYGTEGKSFNIAIG